MNQLCFKLIAAAIFSTLTEVHSWGICPEINSTAGLIDLEQATGSWYLYGWIPSQWSRCHNLTLFYDEANGKYSLLDEYISPILNKILSTNYTVEYEPDSSELKLTSKIFDIIPETTTWTVIDIDYNDYIVLYKCNMISEESQIWVRNEELTFDLEETPEAIAKAIEKLNLKPSDYNLKREFHCL